MLPLRPINVVTRRVLTVRRSSSLFRPHCTVAAVDQKWCSNAFPDVTGVSCRWFTCVKGMIQSIPAIVNTGDRFGRPLRVCYYHGGKCFESNNVTLNPHDISRNHVPHTGNCSEMTSPAVSHHVGKWSSVQ